MNQANPVAAILVFAVLYALVAPFVGIRFGRRGLALLSTLATLGLATGAWETGRVALLAAFGLPAILGILATTYTIWRLSKRPTPPSYLRQCALGLAALISGAVLTFLLVGLACVLFLCPG